MSGDNAADGKHMMNGNGTGDGASPVATATRSEVEPPELLPTPDLPDGRNAITAPPADSATEAVETAEASHGSTIAVVAAIIGNILVGIVKFIAAGISGSSAMVSEGIHSIVDSGNGMLVMLGMKRASKKANPEHPFGYGKELYFWTLVVAVMIFALGGGFSIYEGITHLMDAGHSAALGDPTLNYIVILVAAAIEGTSLFIAVRSFNAARGGIGPIRFIKEAKDPSLYTVVLEDSAAELGLVFAFLGVFLTHATGIPYFDGAASVLIGVLLCCVATVLLRETKGLLIGEGLKLSEINEIERIVEADKNVVECGRILTMFFGPSDLLVTIDATFKPECTRDDIASSIDSIERGIVARFPETGRIFIETESLRFTHEQAEQRDRIERARIEAGDVDLIGAEESAQ